MIGVDVLISIVWPNVAQKSFWDARFGLFGDIANIDARLVHGLR
jgi:hypothetical protein